MQKGENIKETRKDQSTACGTTIVERDVLPRSSDWFGLSRKRVLRQVLGTWLY